MKILAFVDTHESQAAHRSLQELAEREKPDLLLCAGDFTLFGHAMERMLSIIDGIGIRTLLIHGNHEDAGEVREAVRDLKHIEFNHRRTAEIGGYAFVGWGGGGFALSDTSFDHFAKTITTALPIVLVTHGPPFNTAIDFVAGEHCGNRSYTDFIERRRPLLAIAGHLHENSGKQELYRHTLVVNPGPRGMVFGLSEVERLVR